MSTFDFVPPQSGNKPFKHGAAVDEAPLVTCGTSSFLLLHSCGKVRNLRKLFGPFFFSSFDVTRSRCSEVGDSFGKANKDNIQLPSTQRLVLSHHTTVKSLTNQWSGRGLGQRRAYWEIQQPITNGGGCGGGDTCADNKRELV